MSDQQDTPPVEVLRKFFRYFCIKIEKKSKKGHKKWVNIANC